MKNRVGILILVVALCVAFTGSVFASNKPSEEFGSDELMNQLQAMVYSPEYPNAYMLFEESSVDNTSMDKGFVNGRMVSVSVFVEEHFSVVDDQYIVTGSRLLSKEEVDRIGLSRFSESKSYGTPPSDTNSYGKLTLLLGLSYQTIGNGIEVYIDTCSANWSGFNFFYNPQNNPAAGDDFMGLTWGGGYTAPSMSCSIDGNPGPYTSPSLAAFAPNAGRVYRFLEYLYFGDTWYYVEAARLSGYLSKNTLTGNGNTTEIGLTYVHTYQNTTLSATINVSSNNGVSGGFTVSGTTNQWSLACVVTGFPY